MSGSSYCQSQIMSESDNVRAQKKKRNLKKMKSQTKKKETSKK